MLLEKMEIIQEFPASAILPSETHVSRWLLQQALSQISLAWLRDGLKVIASKSLLRENWATMSVLTRYLQMEPEPGRLYATGEVIWIIIFLSSVIKNSTKSR